MPWDLFCRVIDNHGDIGVCWRLAADLAVRGQPVRLWTDNAAALAWMAPQHVDLHPGVQVLRWPQAESSHAPGEVVIEAFGCDPPPAFVARMAAMRPPPLWLNLEYLSAEAQAERNHGLPSPQFHWPAAGLVKHFFYPGFTPASGGLLREPALLARQAAFDATAWLAGQGVWANTDERTVSLFCYPGAPVDALIDRLAGQPTVLLATAGHATQAVRAALGPALRRGALRTVCLPWLDQPNYDHLLWSCTLNCVRGEDSFVRAQWAGRPFLWQIYPQDDGADRLKLEAFLNRFEGIAHAGLAIASGGMALRALWHGWNGWAALPEALPKPAAWLRECLAWRGSLLAQEDLVTRLQAFVARTR